MGLAQEGYSALSRFIPNGSYARDVVFSGTEIRIQHSQGVPFRVFTLDARNRLIVEFNAVTFAGLEEEVFSRSQSCLLYTSPSPRDLSTSRMPSSA